jgi:hypothetical protein
MKSGRILTLRLVAATILLFLALAMPNRPDAMSVKALARLPLELPVILAVLVAFPVRGRATATVRVALVVALVATLVFNLADLATFTAYGRDFNPLVDRHLAGAAWDLAAGAIGPAPAALALGGTLAAVGLGALLLWWATGQWTALHPPRGWRWLAAGTALLAGTVAVADAVHDVGGQPKTAGASAARLAYMRAASYGATLAELRAFEDAARADPFAEATVLLDRLAGRDVLLVFVESYGRASFDTPLYASMHRSTLHAAADALEAAGLAMRSAWLTSPIRGGQSWLAQTTLVSGLWISDQRRYRAYLASSRLSLFDYASKAGFRTAAVMPAITRDWPEGDLMQFGTVLASSDLGYRGKPFNWVTMPDQYTLTALDRLLEPGAATQQPLFAQVALISSHAPWVPIPPVIDWDAVGDGRVFDAWATSGDPPEVVWRDRDRIRRQYRLAVDYSLRTLTQYALRHASDPPLVVVLGDHQPAQFVSQSDSFDVPIHVIGPPELIAHLDAWGWSDGLVPMPGAPVWPMDRFRDRFLAAFSGGAPIL